MHRQCYGENVHLEEVRSDSLSVALAEAALRVAVLEEERATVRVHQEWDSEEDTFLVFLFVSD